MITAKAILDSVNRELLHIFPDCFYYVDFSEKEFKRPSFLILADRRGKTKKSTRRVSSFVLYMTIVYYAETNAYYRADKMGLQDVRDTVTALFAKEYLLVDDRAVRLTVSDGGIREKEAYIDIEIRYTEETGAPEKDAGAPTIKRVKSKIR